MEPSFSNSDLKDETSFISEGRSVGRSVARSTLVRELEGEDGDLRFLGGITSAVEEQ